MKGISTTLVFLIVAVIAGVLILWFMWSKGMLPWLGGATEAQCRTDLSKVCGGQMYWDEAREKDKLCYIYFRGIQETKLKSCLQSQIGVENTDCDDFCSEFLGG